MVRVTGWILTLGVSLPGDEIGEGQGGAVELAVEPEAEVVQGESVREALGHVSPRASLLVRLPISHERDANLRDAYLGAHQPLEGLPKGTRGVLSTWGLA